MQLSKLADEAEAAELRGGLERLAEAKARYGKARKQGGPAGRTGEEAAGARGAKNLGTYTDTVSAQSEVP